MYMCCCDDRYKTRAHKAESRLQEEVAKQKTTPSTPDNTSADPPPTYTVTSDPQPTTQDKV